MIEPYQRRTVRLSRQVGGVVRELAGRAGARVLAGLGLVMSRQTALRELLRPPLPASSTPRVIGVDDFVTRVLDTMRRAQRHTFFTLTKRPAHMIHLLRRLRPHPLPNAWWGTTVEDNKRTGRCARLRATPAAVRFLALQPMLGPLPELDFTGLDRVYVGGESGAAHRPMLADWVRDIRDRCVDAGIPFLFKQWGGATRNAGGRELDGVTWSQMPSGHTRVTRHRSD